MWLLAAMVWLMSLPLLAGLEGALIAMTRSLAVEWMEMRVLSRQEVQVTEDGETAEVTIQLDLTLLLRTLRQLPDGAGTERFLAAYEVAGSSDASPAA